MEIKDELIKLINNNKFHKMTIDEIFSALKLEPLEFATLVKEINKLEQEGIIYIKKDNEIYNSSSLNIFNGKVKSIDQYQLTILLDDGRKAYVQKNRSKYAYINDDVKVHLYYNKDGEILKILQRNTWKLLAFYKNGKIILDDQNFPFRVRLIENANLKNNDLVVLDIVKYDKSYVNCKVNKILGKTTDPGMDILKEIIKSNVHYEFDEEVISYCVNRVKEYENNLKKEFKNRLNLTNLLTITIDGKDAKDLDDAISLKVLENGNYYLGVHIADVSYFVNENSIIDKEAFSRGTSIYLADRVIPMLPQILSNDACSLNANETKLTMSCLMEINYQGEVVDFKIAPSFIRSNARLNYDEVNALFENKDNSIDLEIKNMLYKMRILSSILSKKMYKRGYLQLDVDEAKLILDENKKVIDIVKREQNEAEKLIENFMILANETVATYVNKLNLPFVYRIHDKPPFEKLSTLKESFEELSIKINAEPNQFYLQKILEKYHNTELEEVISSIILHYMSKAIYSTNNIGHYGLGSKCYCHFTSPIRRYPDLIVHRLLKKYLQNEINVDMNKLVMIADNSSVLERKAQVLERDVEDIKKAEYMQNFIGKIFHGVVTGVKEFGVFVALDNTCEGLIIPSTIYEYNDYDLNFNIGMKVNVKVISCNVEKGEINFAYMGKKDYNKNIKKGKRKC